MDNQQKLFQVLADILNVDIASLNEESSPDTIRNWDSLAVVNLVSELEQTFKVEFDILEIADFRNVGIIKSILAEKGVIF
jgi:acyl carrier protein